MSLMGAEAADQNSDEVRRLTTILAAAATKLLLSAASACISGVCDLAISNRLRSSGEPIGFFGMVGNSAIRGVWTGAGSSFRDTNRA
jgi:hypothetical protein